MKRYLVMFLAALAVAGCAAYVTPRGTFIEPLFPPIVIGPPAVIEPAPWVVVRPLPPVVVVPGSSLYFYDNYYYYNWEGGWYWSNNQRGPWHVLPRDRWPSRMEQRDRGNEERGGPHWRGGGRD